MDDTGILPNTENPAGKTYEKKHNDIYYDLPVQLAGQAKGIWMEWSSCAASLLFSACPELG